MTREESISCIVQGEDSRTQFKRGVIGVTKLAMAAFLGKTREAIRVYVRQLKERYNLLKRIGSPKSGTWKVLKVS